MQQVASGVIVAVCLLFGDIDVMDQFKPANMQMTEDGVAVMQGVPQEVFDWLVPPDGADPTRLDGLPVSLPKARNEFAGRPTASVMTVDWPQEQQRFFLEKQGDDLIRRLKLADKDGFTVELRPAESMQDHTAHVTLSRQRVTGGRYDETLDAYVEKPVLKKAICEATLEARRGSTTVLLWETPEEEKGLALQRPLYPRHPYVGTYIIKTVDGPEGRAQVLPDGAFLLWPDVTRPPLRGSVDDGGKVAVDTESVGWPYRVAVEGKIGWDVMGKCGSGGELAITQHRADGEATTKWAIGDTGALKGFAGRDWSGERPHAVMPAGEVLSLDVYPDAIVVVLQVGGAGAEEPPAQAGAEAAETAELRIDIQSCVVPLATELWRELGECEDVPGWLQRAMADGTVDAGRRRQIITGNGERKSIEMLHVRGTTGSGPTRSSYHIAVAPTVRQDGAIQLLLDARVTGSARYVVGGSQSETPFTSLQTVNAHVIARHGQPVIIRRLYSALPVVSTGKWSKQLVPEEVLEQFILITPTITNPEVLPGELRAKVLGE